MRLSACFLIAAFSTTVFSAPIPSNTLAVPEPVTQEPRDLSGILGGQNTGPIQLPKSPCEAVIHAVSTSSMSDYPALTGFYNLLYLWLEPLSTTIPAIMIWTVPGAAWFHHQLIPDSSPAPLNASMDPRSLMGIWQLGNCYLLLGMLEGLGLRAIRDALPNNAVAQERLAGTILTAMAIADVTHIAASWFALPPALQYTPADWNATTHGNITLVIFLFATRLAWFAGIGRKRYWYGQQVVQSKSKKTK
ncbi:hypothetical protein EIP91_010160 [Steccherinum ochraceum]|uniref:DUF7704 domain-containing protein n=1 Tax=Steccherinum ochraceum TaxID=92696 RepID=A0A4R0S3S3_9APHY|nr:hypothetical protein EIP91_010160 [Steccherinum ochraceum]